MLIHQGWFTALYTQHLLDSQSFDFEICILHALTMPLIRCTNVFSKGGYPVTLLPPPRRLVPSLGLGTTWVRQPRSGSCHYPTAATKCNERPSKATVNHPWWMSRLFLVDGSARLFVTVITTVRLLTAALILVVIAFILEFLEAKAHR